MQISEVKWVEKDISVGGLDKMAHYGFGVPKVKQNPTHQRGLAEVPEQCLGINRVGRASM